MTNYFLLLHVVQYYLLFNVFFFIIKLFPLDAKQFKLDFLYEKSYINVDTPTFSMCKSPCDSMCIPYVRVYICKTHIHMEKSAVWPFCPGSVLFNICRPDNKHILVSFSIWKSIHKSFTTAGWRIRMLHHFNFPNLWCFRVLFKWKCNFPELISNTSSSIMVHCREQLESMFAHFSPWCVQCVCTSYWAISILTRPAWPQVAAACNGVHSSLSWALTVAPRSSRIFTISS